MPTTKKHFKLPLSTSFFKSLFVTVLAEGDGTTTETTPPVITTPPATPPATPTPTPNGTVNFEDLIAKARKEEKDKLYPDIEKWKTKANDHLLVIGERDKEIDRLTKALAKAEKDAEEARNASTTSGNAEANAKISTLEREIEFLKTSHAEDLSKKDLDLYTARKLAEVGTANIIPELVFGKTQEEIDASIETSKARFAAIAQAAVSGVQVPPANPGSRVVEIKIEKTAEEIQKMNHKEYAEYRKGLGIK